MPALVAHLFVCLFVFLSIWILLIVLKLSCEVVRHAYTTSRVLIRDHMACYHSAGVISAQGSSTLNLRSAYSDNRSTSFLSHYNKNEVMLGCYIQR